MSKCRLLIKKKMTAICIKRSLSLEVVWADTVAARWKFSGQYAINHHTASPRRFLEACTLDLLAF